MGVWLNHWRLTSPSWHWKLIIAVPVKLFPLEESQHSYCCILQSTWICIIYIICGEQSFLGKRGYLLKVLKRSMPSPDLWSSGVWCLAQTWAGRTVSTFWSLSISQPSERGVRLSDVSVWVTVVSCSRLPMSCRIGGLHTGEWSLVWPKGLWSLHEASLSHSSGDSWGLFSLFFWLSHGFSEKEVNFWLMEWDYPRIWPSEASSHS